MNRTVAGIVFVHFVVTVFHGIAHARAQVPLSYAASIFVFTIVLAGPLLGIALMWRSRRIGAAVIAMTLAGSFAFGFVNHFVLISPDHIAHVAATWRPLFIATAVLLALTEALGSALALQILRLGRSR